MNINPLELCSPPESTEAFHVLHLPCLLFAITREAERATVRISTHIIENDKQYVHYMHVLYLGRH